MRLVFDRGTLLLREVPRGFDASGLPGVLWDPRIDAWRAPAFRYDALRAALVGAHVAWRDEVAAARRPRPARTGEALAHAESLPPLRPYQEAALDAWALGGRRGIVVLPTGAGK